jgi:DNA replication protein DnaC
MNYQDFSRSKALNNIPSKKVQEKINYIEQNESDSHAKAAKIIAITRYAESNIPIEYWGLNIEKSFHGPESLFDIYKKYISDIKASYTSGMSVCLAGTHGVGKTFVSTSILKKCVNKGFTGLYTTLSDVVATLTQADNEEKFIARRELCMVDFLVIDEFDPRFLSSESSADLYARTLETVFRARSQNKIPTIMCTNSPNVVESFNGSLKASIDSLMKGYLTIVPALGSDFRKRIKE